MRVAHGTVTVKPPPAFSPGDPEQVVSTGRILIFNGWNERQTYANLNLLTLLIEHANVIIQALYIDRGILKSIYILCIHAVHTVVVSCRPKVERTDYVQNYKKLILKLKLIEFLYFV
jgi:hypothetical protein